MAIETAYVVLSERAAIPDASLNIYDAFKKLLDEMPKRTAWVAHAMNMQQTDSKSTALTSWLDRLLPHPRCQHDLMIDGPHDDPQRVRRGGHRHERDHRSARALALYFPPGWFVKSGSESEKSGLQEGFHDSHRAVSTNDEIPPAWASAACNSKQERTKEEICEGGSTYRSVRPVVGSDGCTINQTITVCT
ncbi:MAG: hypothetical protein SGPRY_011426 [Prymnesium sp.]